MNAKLTLKMDDFVIEAAKQFARTHQTSLSKLSETYFKIITREEIPQKRITGVVGELAGLLKNKDIVSSKSDYIDYLEDKYK
ncbi:Antitoxin [Candidatus Magnetomoraceae bacterium gMMP-1]